jgi:hypothetical protein
LRVCELGGAAAERWWALFGRRWEFGRVTAQLTVTICTQLGFTLIGKMGLGVARFDSILARVEYETPDFCGALGCQFTTVRDEYAEDKYYPTKAFKMRTGTLPSSAKLPIKAVN